MRVGTIDDYQGQEARVLLISTVLTRPASLRSAGGGSGSNAAAIHAFSSPNRFNVAITRAKALLVVCGHPQALAEDHPTPILALILPPSLTLESQLR